MKLDEQFDIFYADLGGKLDLEVWKDFLIDDSLYEEIKSLQQILAKTSANITELIHKRGRTESVYISITNDSSINGCCGVTENGDYLLSINIGVLIRLILVSQILWETDSGNKEVFTANDREWIYNIFGYRFSENGDECEIVKIEDEKEAVDLLLNAVKITKSRLIYCKTLYYITNLAVKFAIDFIVLHELHHVCYGHLNPINPKKRLFNRLWESGIDIKNENFQMFQGFESLADYGAGKVFGLRFNDRGGFFSSFPLIVDDHIYCQFLSFSLKVCFSVISFEISFLDAKHLYNSHPHPELRLLSFFDGVRDGINERPYNISNNWRDGIAIGYWAVTKSFQDINIVEPILWSITSNMQAWDNDFYFSAEVLQRINTMCEYRLQSWQENESYFLPFLSAFKSK